MKRLLLAAIVGSLINGSICDTITTGTNDPDQVRLAFLPSGMSVSWTTPSALSSNPQVKYGTSKTTLDNTATGNSHTYGTSYFHDVLLNNLSHKTLYYYQVIADTVQGDVLNFTSAAQPGDTNPFSVLLVGDMGLTNSANTMTSLNSELSNTDFILHVGDISYADDYYLRGDDYENSWTKWQDLMEPVTSSKAYMTLPGNHEVTCNEVTPFLCPAGQKNFTAYKHRFRMPGPESGGLGNLWYSYDYGMTHFIHLNFESDFPSAPSGPGSWLNGGGETGQTDWLEQDLQKAVANRAKVPWIIAAGHRPYYTSGKTCDACKTAFEPLFNKYGVDIYFSGHVHWYERLYAIAPGGVIQNQNYTNPTAPVYIVNGAAGNVEGHSTGSQQPFTAKIDSSDYGYGKISFASSSELKWQYFRATDKSLVDEITLTKQH